MKVNMHHQIMKMRADSLLVRAAIQTPRQTNQLASTARQKSCSGGRFILVSTSFSTKALTPAKLSASKRPPRTTIQANSTLPTKLPTHVHTQLEQSSHGV